MRHNNNDINSGVPLLVCERKPYSSDIIYKINAMIDLSKPAIIC